MSRYRILRLITWLPHGGIERKIAALLPRLDRELFEPHICCIRERGPMADAIEADGIPIHVIRFRNRWDPIALWQLKLLVQRLHIDLIHSHMYRSNVPATIMKMLNRRVAVAGQYHNVNTWETPSQLRMDRRLAQRRDMNIAVSEAVRDELVSRLGLPEEKTRTIYNGVDTREFRPVAAAERHAIRERLGLPAAARLVVMSARLHPQKNQRLVIENASEILRTVPRAHFLFAGSGAEEPALRAMAQQAGVAEHVSFVGQRNDMPQLLAACDVSVLPSLKEGFSNAILEAMACGLPVVASDVGGNREVIDRGINGYILDVLRHPSLASQAEEVNAAQFVRYVKRLLTDDEFRLNMGAAARRDSLAFGLEAMLRRVQETYLELLGDPLA